MERKEAVTIFLNKARTIYIEDQRAKGIRASGRSAEGLRIEPTEALGRLYGADYFHFQKVGRKPGGFPPIESIIEWLKEKKTFRIDEDRGPGLKGLAFLIARKIAKKGTDIYLGKRPGLSVEEKILEARKELVSNFAGIMKEDYLTKLKTLKNGS